MLTNRQVFIVRGARDRPVDLGKAVLFVLIPLPDFWWGVGRLFFHGVVVVFIRGGVELIVRHDAVLLFGAIVSRQPVVPISFLVVARAPWSKT